MKLYCFGESGHSYKVALALELAQAKWDPVKVDFFGGEARSAQFRALNPMGELPVLTDAALTLTQSGVILQYVAEKTGKFGAQNDKEQREIWRWLLFDAHKLSSQAGVLRFNMNFLPDDKRNAEVEGWLAKRLSSALRVLNTHLESHDWILGDRATIADFANCGYLFYPEPFTFDRSHYPAIDAWLDRICNLPHWAGPYDLMPGSPADRA